MLLKDNFIKSIFRTPWVVYFLYLLIIFFTTFPLLMKFCSYMPGFFSTDESFSVLWNSWVVKFSLLNKFSLGHIDLIAYPFGINLYSGLISYVFFVINFFLIILTTPVLVYNIQVVVNLFLTALFSYFFVFYLTKNRMGAFFSGIIFGFCPYIFVRSWQHLGATYLWPIPLFTWFLFRLRQENSLKIKILFILSFILSTINFDITYYLLLICAVFIFYLSLNLKTYFNDIKRIFFLIFIAFIILIPQSLPIISNVIFKRDSIPLAQNIFHRPFEDLITQSAKPLSYFLPAAVHPIFGKFTENFVGTQLYGTSFTEHTLYLGWVPLILAFVAFRRWRRKRREVKSLGTVPLGGSVSSSGGDSPFRENFYIGFFVWLAIVAWFFSQPPWWKIGPIKIYMPSFFMYKVLPMVRAYCRFGIVVMLAIAVLAGFGLKFILERFKSPRTKIALTCLFSGLVLFEFWNYPPFKVIDVSRVPEVYYWLKEQPEDFVIAEYPLDIIGPSELYKLYQTKHEKKIINATIPGTYAHKVAKTIIKLSEAKTAGVLKWMGVRYVLVHREDYLKTELIEDREELSKIPRNSGLKFIKSFPNQECPQKDIMCVQKTGPIDVYEVIAKPEEPRIK